MIPAWLLRFLPHIGVALALGGFVWWVHHDGVMDERRAAEARNAKLEKALRSDLRQSETRLALRLNAIDATLGEQRAGIERTRNILQPTITRELTRETRYSDPAAGISGELRKAIDTARAAVACTARPDGGIDCALPAPVAAQGQ